MSKLKSLNEKEIKVAIVHDWLYGGGAEKVVLAIHEMYPDAPIYTSFSTKEWEQRLNHRVVTGYLNKWPFSKLRKFIPVLRILWFQHLDLTKYDLVISSSGAEAKGVKKLKKGAIHVNYCHAPTHYYWSMYSSFIKEPGFGMFNGLARTGLKILVNPLRKWDYKAAHRPNYIIANSTYIQGQIKQYYGRESTVINPPVDVERFVNSVASSEKKGMVITGRQVPYKKIDLAIKAAIKLTMELTVIGKGPLHQELVNLASGHKNIKFINNATDETVARQLAQAQLFLFPCIEDFGIAPVEAIASGTPLVALKKGGALDYVNETNGIFFSEQKVSSIVKAIELAKNSTWSSELIQRSSLKFSKSNFKDNFSKFLKTI